MNGGQDERNDCWVAVDVAGITTAANLNYSVLCKYWISGLWMALVNVKAWSNARCAASIPFSELHPQTTMSCKLNMNC
jgi:hypothetical protein